MTAWGICTTVKAPEAQVLAFLAHHLDLGASHIWLFFDDPADPVGKAVADLPHVTATPCTEDYWQALCKRRPDRHQNRQSRNMQAVYAASDLPFVAHIDVDEFILPEHPVAGLLASVPEDQPMVRIAPWEALHDAALPDDIFTARQFRSALRGAGAQGLRDLAFGHYAALLPDGTLSHSVGKCFFRTGVSRMEPRLHGAFRAGVRMQGGPFHPDLALLHFHAEDRARWLDRLAFRLARGAYQTNAPLQAHLTAATPADVADFYARVQAPPPEVRAGLASAGVLRDARLDLRAKMARLTGA